MNINQVVQITVHELISIANTFKMLKTSLKAVSILNNGGKLFTKIQITDKKILMFS